MNKYMVACMDFFDNELVQLPISADSELDAMFKYLAQQRDIVFDEDALPRLDTAETLKEQCFDMDMLISAIKI